MAYDPELQMLRELVWNLLGIGDGIQNCPDAPRCFVCGRHLLRAEGINRTFGHRRHTQVKTKLTVHHIDENRDNNALYNTVIVHRACHKKYHNQKRAEESPHANSVI